MHPAFLFRYWIQYINQLDRSSIIYIQKHFLEKSGGIDIIKGNEINKMLQRKTCCRKHSVHFELHEAFLFYTKPSEIFQDMRRYR